MVKTQGAILRVRHTSVRPIIEQMESRRLTAVGTASVAAGATVGPLTVLPGGERAVAHVTFTNTGTTALRGVWRAGVLLATDPAASPGDTLVGSRLIPLALAPGKSRVLPVNVQISGNVDDGSYFLFGEALHWFDVSSTPFISSGVPIDVTRLPISVSPQIQAAPASTIGTTATISVILTNDGTTTVAGDLSVTASLSASVPGSLQFNPAVLDADRHVSLRPGKSTAFRFRLPIDATDLPGNYSWLASGTLTSSPGLNR